MALDEFSSSLDAREVATAWLTEFSAALAAKDVSAASRMFAEHGYWRDILALTWTMKSFGGWPQIATGLNEALSTAKPTPFQLEPREPEVYYRKGWGWTIEGFVTFETEYASCRGHLRLLGDPEGNGGWEAWTFLTVIDDLKNYPERAGEHRPKSEPFVRALSSADQLSRAAGEDSDEALEPQVLILGAGQAGLTLAARLDRLGVSTLLVERERRVGDNWRNRYQSLVLHNQIWANHLPYLPFPSSWPVYVTKDHLAEWLETYASLMSLNVLTSTEFVDGHYDQNARRWTVRLRSDAGERVLHPEHLVVATGVFGIPRRPEFVGSAVFAGTVMDAGEYRGRPDAKGLNVLVIGAGTSAHDAAQGLCEAGAQVTMLQRSSTCVVSIEPGAARAYAIYSEDGLPVDDCDLVTLSYPFPLLAETHRDLTARIAAADESLLDGLRAAGFEIDFGVDGSGFLMKYYRSGGGYYINVGCSDLIAAGKIKMLHKEVDHLTKDGAVFTDGSSMNVDMIVNAIGYQNMSESVRALLGDEIAERVGPVWGIGEEGEIRAMWQRTGQPGLWIMGGSLQQCRPYSKYLAIQIKAEIENIRPIPPQLGDRSSRMSDGFEIAIVPPL